jgi:hypothetical protein
MLQGIAAAQATAALLQVPGVLQLQLLVEECESLKH